MATIILEDGYETIVDDKHVKFLSGFRWYVIHPDDDNKPYVALYLTNKVTRGEMKLLHRVVMSLKMGRPILRHEWVDHEDRDTFRNTEDNLRFCTPSQNSQNRGKGRNNTTGYKGVDQLKSGRFRAQITTDWLYKYLGTYATAEDAARAYDKAARKYHKEFAVLNFPNEPFE